MISAKKTPENSRYPIHYLVWHNKHRQLEKELATKEQVRRGIAIKPHLSLPPQGRFFILIWACGTMDLIGGRIDAIHGASHSTPYGQYVGIAQLIVISGVEGATCNAKI